MQRFGKTVTENYRHINGRTPRSPEPNSEGWSRVGFVQWDVAAKSSVDIASEGTLFCRVKAPKEATIDQSTVEPFYSPQDLG